jgi:hypothetical protein
MVQLCFVIDLRTLAPPLLRDLKQALLQLANFYAISSSSSSSLLSKLAPSNMILRFVFLICREAESKRTEEVKRTEFV